MEQLKKIPTDQLVQELIDRDGVEKREQRISHPIEVDAQIETRIRDANLDFSGLLAENGTPTLEVGQITVGMIKYQSGDSACKC